MDKRWLLAIGFLGLLIWMFGGGAKAEVKPGALTNPWMIKPQAVPTTAKRVCEMGTDIPCGRDLYVCYAEVAITGQAGAVDVTIKDAQSSPISMLPAAKLSPTSVTEGAMYPIFQASTDQSCRWFPGGISVLGSATGATIYLSGKY